MMTISLSIIFFQGHVLAQNELYQNSRSCQAIFIEQSPIIDGQILNEACWQNIQPIGELVQSQPNSNSSPTEKTEIRIAYDKNNLYISVLCFDKEPEKLVMSDARRDASLSETDAILFILDTYNDGQNGFMFGTNTIGTQYDAQVDNEGQGNFSANRQQSGTIGGFNINWDASWEVETMVGDFGWAAEFAIPFKTLRFKSGSDETWGINFRRNIRKNNEICYWSPLPIEFDLKRLSLAGKLGGLNLENQGNLKVIPYVLGSASTNHQETESEVDYSGTIGADLKYSITPSLTLDLTYNTDFAQVEVDEQQVNLDRFNLFFPEKRPFFLENAGLFSVGSAGEVDLFFSRRIGIGENGQQVPIIGGARLSGKVKNTNIGFLNMYTDQTEDEEIGKNAFTVARVNHEFAERSSFGAAFINKTGLEMDDDHFNNTYALDGKLGLGKKAQLSGFFARSNSPDISSQQYAFKAQAQYEWAGWNLRAAYTEVGEGFNPEVGFLQRESFRKPEFLIFYKMRAKEESMFLENRPHISYRSYWNLDNSLQTSYLHIDNHWVWKKGFEVHTGINFTGEGVYDAFEISEGVVIPAGTYKHIESQIVIITNPSKPLSISTRHINGGFFGGKRYANSATLSFRIGEKFTSEWIYRHNDIRLPYGDFTADIFGARLSYSFTPKIYLQSLIQYNDVSKIWFTNVRFGWLRRANSGLFLVFNQGRQEGQLDQSSFILKYSHLFDLLK